MPEDDFLTLVASKLNLKFVKPVTDYEKEKYVPYHQFYHIQYQYHDHAYLCYHYTQIIKLYGHL